MRDCSWFRSCDLEQLHRRAPTPEIALSFRSARAAVGHSAPRLHVQWSGVHRQHNLVCRTQGGGFGSPSGPLLSNFSALQAGDIYQFGVAEGYSLRSLLQIFDKSKAWAFDTFQGMPDTESGEETFQTTWKRGAFRPSAAKRSAGAVRLPMLSQFTSRVETIPGVFKNSLVPGLAAQRGMDPAAYVDIDSDLFSSAKDALDWLFREGLIVQGTVIGYDDYWDLACKQRSAQIEMHGEAMAHAKISAKYKVSFKCICGPCAPLPPHSTGSDPAQPWGWRTYFVVESIGERINSGLTMSSADAHHFLEYHSACRGLWDRNVSHWLGIE